MKVIIYGDSLDSYSSIPFSVDQKDVLEGSNLKDFIHAVGIGIDLVAHNELRFEASYPDYIINTEVDLKQFKDTVTWKINKMLPGAFGSKPRQNEEVGTREVKPRLRETAKWNGEAWEVFGQTMHAWIQFDIWSGTAAKAENIVEWFRTYFMAMYGPKFGANELRFILRKQDDDVQKINNKLHVRSLVYFVQLEEVTAKKVAQIQKISAQIEQAIKTTDS